jgi:hypothetical protein
MTNNRQHGGLSVFDEEQQEYANLSLFPDDREVPADAGDSLQVKMSGLELRRPRRFGSCWWGCELWRQLGLDKFWDARLADREKRWLGKEVLQLLASHVLPKQFHLPAALVKLRDGKCGQHKVVRQEFQSRLGLLIDVTDATSVSGCANADSNEVRMTV